MCLKWNLNNLCQALTTHIKRRVRACNELSCTGWSEKVFFAQAQHGAFSARTWDSINMKWLPTAVFFLAFTVQAEPEMCFTKAGHDFGIDPRLLMAHSIQESRMRNNAINNKSARKSTDVCNMQINSSNFNALKKFNITREIFCAWSNHWNQNNWGFLTLKLINCSNSSFFR